LNIALTAVFISLRNGDPITKQLRGSGGAYLNMLALAPVAWLMAQMYLKAGWWAVLLFAVPLYTTRLAYRRFVEVREMFTETVKSLAEAVDKRDKFTSGHSQNVQEIAMDIGRVMKVSDDDLEALEWGGLLHDIGKIGVPDSVLLKQDRLTRAERQSMNAHPVLGAEIIAPVKRLEPELPIIRHHHEWFNGSGYPDRLVGDEIPKLARILHVADAFEAMTAARPYRMTPLTPEQALAELRKFGGIQFDPEVVDAFVRTKWARGLADPGSDEVRAVPLIGEAAGSMASLAAGATPSGAAG
jgi:putative nucleotidyltransferase with HDIG domain